MKKLVFDKDRVAEARDIRTRWYKGEKIDRTPFTFSVTPTVSNGWIPGNPYSFKEMCEDSSKAVEGWVASIQHQFDTFPDCDFLPVMLPYYLGEGILAAMYGSEQVIVDDNPPFTGKKVFTDVPDTARMSNDFEIEDTEWGRILKKHIERFIDATDGQVPIGMADYQSPYGTATKLVPNEELMLGMYDYPDVFHNFLQKVTDGIIKLITAMERWVGMDLIAHNVQNPIPGQRGLTLWDDYISVITPALHKEFCVPYNRQLYDRYGYGHLHTCGPYFPGYIDACVACSPRSMDIGIMRGFGRTRQDLLAFQKIAMENNILIYGSLATTDKHIKDDDWQQPDVALYETFIRGGFMPSGGGTYEEGLEFKKMIDKIDAVIYR